MYIIVSELVLLMQKKYMASLVHTTVYGISNQDTDTLNNLACFVYHSFKRHNEFNTHVL